MPETESFEPSQNDELEGAREKLQALVEENFTQFAQITNEMKEIAERLNRRKPAKILDTEIAAMEQFAGVKK
ncbi:MAG: hypothetical protein COT81_02540 [Candidatus Buchananbacteria bacterium CG10_big_fil_rev_8_21_14_0_10_42_9]|uniref:Uncharacterized protein n=1 Tax=Candidatus Buchananbacteria bacterium CG10_big_fil_rev_8_21_14_0_10_42_9 TaxID=1974526 RepID=A0A2H0W1F8_9BACT|nr:MAG: hypothetical protein COT81_02540 [Candidatus Buchananbacteria bacterium CG10_big_fil_rev_8_21_14_0_10_42_9]